MVTGTSRVVAALYSATLFAYFAVIFNFAPVRPLSLYLRVRWDDG